MGIGAKWDQQSSTNWSLVFGKGQELTGSREGDGARAGGGDDGRVGRLADLLLETARSRVQKKIVGAARQMPTEVSHESGSKGPIGHHRKP